MGRNMDSLIRYIRNKIINCDLKYINYVLYYADFKTVLDRCEMMTDSTYHFINNMPYNSAILAEMKPIETFHLKQLSDDDLRKITPVQKRAIDDVIDEYHMIKAKFGEKGLDDFVKNICNISGRPTINGFEMLIYISLEWDRKERKAALDHYRQIEELKNTLYKILLDDKEIACSKYI